MTARVEVTKKKGLANDFYRLARTKRRK